MAYLTQPDYVKYVCSCGLHKPITQLYFCRHCLQLRCGFCICHEVDSHYCANCLENMPSSEARMKKNKCSSCFDCPSCFHTLSTRATLTQPWQNQEAGGSGDNKVENKQPKKMYYLSCFNCRWTSRDVGIPDQPVASGGWPEWPHPFAARFSQLVDYYKALHSMEKHEKLEKKKFTVAGKYITLTDKTGVTSSMARYIAGLPPPDAGVLSTIANLTPSQATDELNDLPDDIFTKEVDLNKITSMAQRLSSPGLQPASASLLAPIPRPLAAKKSQRCRCCDRTLAKPDYNPGSVRFKIDLLAYHHVPEVKIISYEPIKRGASCQLIVKLTNPTCHEMLVKFMQPEDIPPVEERTEEPRSGEKSLEKSLGLDKECGPSRQVSRRRSALPRGCRLVPPSGALALAQRDDAAEYDDHDVPRPDHPSIVWRKTNKMAVKLEIQTDETAEIGSPAQLAFALEYSYRNTVLPTTTPTQYQDHILYTTILLELGLFSG